MKIGPTGVTCVSTSTYFDISVQNSVLVGMPQSLQDTRNNPPRFLFVDPAFGLASDVIEKFESGSK